MRAETHANLGLVLNDIGSPEEAKQKFMHAVEINPNYAEAHRFLSLSKNYTKDDLHLAKMLELDKDCYLKENEQSHLKFAIAKAYKDIGEYNKAFDYYLVANELRRKLLNYNPANDKILFLNLKKASLDFNVIK